MAARVSSVGGGFFHLEEAAGRAIGAVRLAWRRHRVFRATVAELARLSPREREDIGLAGMDVEAVARAAARRAVAG